MKHYFTTAAVALVLGAGVLLASGSLRANDTENIAVTATVIEPVVITENAPMAFGTVGGPASATIVLDTADSRTATGGGFFIGTGVTSADFSITCEDTANVQATVANETMSNGYTIGTFTFLPNLAVSTLCADQTGVKIGATLTFPGVTPPAGAQTGSFDLTVAYQ